MRGVIGFSARISVVPLQPRVRAVPTATHTNRRMTPHVWLKAKPCRLERLSDRDCPESFAPALHDGLVVTARNCQSGNHSGQFPIRSAMASSSANNPLTGISDAAVDMESAFAYGKGVGQRTKEPLLTAPVPPTSIGHEGKTGSPDSLSSGIAKTGEDLYPGHPSDFSQHPAASTFKQIFDIL